MSSIPKPIDSKPDFDQFLKYDSGFNEELQYTSLYGFKRQERVYQSAINWAIDQGDQPKVVRAKYATLNLYMRYRKIPEFLALAHELLNYVTLLSPKQHYYVVLNLRQIYESIEAYNELLKLIPELGKAYEVYPEGAEQRPDKNIEFAWAYYYTHNYEFAAEEFLEEAERYRKKGKNEVMVASMINNAGLSYAKQGNIEKAKKLYASALEELNNAEYGELPNSKLFANYFKEVIAGSYAELALEKGDYDTVIPIFKRLVQLSKLPEVSDGFKRYQSYYFLADAFAKKGVPEIALTYIDSATIFTRHKTAMKIKIATLKGRIMLQLDSVSSATSYFLEANKMRDSIQQIQVARDNMVAQAKFASQKKEDELEKIREDVAVKDRISNYLWWALLVAAFLLTIIGIYYLKSLKNNRTIRRQKERLENSVREKEILLKEVHHRVKNNLQVITGLLQLQSKKTKSPTMIKALEDSQRHVNSMALVHEMLYQQEEHALVPMDGYLRKLTNQLLYSLSGKHIVATVEVANTIELSINKAIPLGLILSELLSNTNKYAFEGDTGNVSVDLEEKQKGYFLFTYADNGRGLPADYKKKLKKTLGFRLLHMLAEEIDGTLEVHGNNGVKVMMNFKDEHHV